MTIRFLAELTEPRTKAASLLPFAFGAAWASWRYGVFAPGALALFMASLLPIDLATTALNNALDWRRSARAAGETGERVRGVSFRAALAIALFLFAVGVGCGLTLAARSDPAVFFIGAAAVAVALAYSAGPLPISRTPFGEAFSGFTMGAGIPFVAALAQFPPALEPPVRLSFPWPSAVLSVNIPELAAFFLASAPYVLLIAAVMLANNLRDLRSDRLSGRLTLPMAIGRRAALALFAALQASSLLACFFGVAAGVLPLPCLGAALSIPFAFRSTLRFIRSESDSVPFGVSVGNLFAIGGLIALGTVLGAAFKAF